MMEALQMKRRKKRRKRRRKRRRKMVVEFQWLNIQRSVATL